MLRKSPGLTVFSVSIRKGIVSPSRLVDACLPPCKDRSSFFPKDSPPLSFPFKLIGKSPQTLLLVNHWLTYDFDPLLTRKPCSSFKNVRRQAHYRPFLLSGSSVA